MPKRLLIAAGEAADSADALGSPALLTATITTGPIAGVIAIL